jgi:hypothetical protein
MASGKIAITISKKISRPTNGISHENTQTAISTIKKAIVLMKLNISFQFQ